MDNDAEHKAHPSACAAVPVYAHVNTYDCSAVSADHEAGSVPVNVLLLKSRVARLLSVE